MISLSWDILHYNNPPEESGETIEVNVSMYGGVSGVMNFSTSAYKSGDVSVPAHVAINGEDAIKQWVYDNISIEDIPGNLGWEDDEESISTWGMSIDEDSFESDDYPEVNNNDWDTLVEEAKELLGMEDEEEDV